MLKLAQNLAVSSLALSSTVLMIAFYACGRSEAADVPNNGASFKSPELARLNESLKTKPHKPLDLKMRALIRLQAGQPKLAISDLDEYATSCPNSWMALACRAMAKAAATDDLGALQDLTRYLYVKRNVSFHLQDTPERSDVENKSHPGPIAPSFLAISVAECNQLRQTFAHQLNGSSNANYQAQAILSFFQHDYRTALATLEKIKAKGPDLAVVLALRSICHRAIGAFDVSISEARQAITLAKQERVFYDTLDGAFFAADKREEGLKELSRMAAGSPSNLNLHLSLADVNSQLGNRDKAREILSAILKENPNVLEARLMRADIYKADLMNEKAYADYSVVEKSSPQNGKAVEGMGFCCYELNQVDKALSYFFTAERLAYDLKRVYAAQALCFEKKGNRLMAVKLHSASMNFTF